MVTKQETQFWHLFQKRSVVRKSNLIELPKLDNTLECAFSGNPG